MSLLLAGLVAAGTSGALFLGRLLARRRAAAEDARRDEDDDARGDEGSGGSVGAEERAKDEATADDERRAKAEVEAEVPTRAAEDDEDPSPKEPSGRARAKRPRRPSSNGPRGSHLEGFVCQLGDVVMRLTGEEAWLAGGVVLSEPRGPAHPEDARAVARGGPGGDDVAIAVLFVAPDAGHDRSIYARTRPRDAIVWLEPLEPSAVLVAGEPPSAVEHEGVRFERARRLPLRSRRIGVGAPDLGDAVTLAEYVSAGAERLLVLKASTGVVRVYRGLELGEGSFEVIASGESTLDP